MIEYADKHILHQKTEQNKDKLRAWYLTESLR